MVRGLHPARHTHAAMLFELICRHPVFPSEWHTHSGLEQMSFDMSCGVQVFEATHTAVSRAVSSRWFLDMSCRAPVIPGLGTVHRPAPEEATTSRRKLRVHDSKLKSCTLIGHAACGCRHARSSSFHPRVIFSLLPGVCSHRP